MWAFKIGFGLISLFWTYYTFLLLNDPHIGGIETAAYFMFETPVVLLLAILAFIKKTSKTAILFLAWNTVLVISVIFRLAYWPGTYPYSHKHNEPIDTIK